MRVLLVSDEQNMQTHDLVFDALSRRHMDLVTIQAARGLSADYSQYGCIVVVDSPGIIHVASRHKKPGATLVVIVSEVLPSDDRRLAQRMALARRAGANAVFQSAALQAALRFINIKEAAVAANSGEE